MSSCSNHFEALGNTLRAFAKADQEILHHIKAMSNAKTRAEVLTFLSNLDMIQMDISELNNLIMGTKDKLKNSKKKCHSVEKIIHSFDKLQKDLNEVATTTKIMND